MADAARVRTATPADRERWDAFVRSRQESDILQAWAWGDCTDLVGERPVRLVAEDESGELRGLGQLLVRSAGSGRTVGYVPHGPVWVRGAAGAETVLTALLNGIAEAARRERAIVVKLDPRGDDGTADALDALVRRGRLSRTDDLQAPTTRIVDLLDGGDALMASWHADARRLSRRAEREGVEVAVDRSGERDAIGAFHRLLEITAERAEFRPRSEEFLHRLATAFADGDGWYLGIARSDGVPIAGMAFPRLGDRAYYLYGASLRDPAYKHKYGPYAVMAALQRQLAADGVRTLDMWGVVEPDDAGADLAWEGFSAFKRTFGGTPLRHPGTFDLVIDPLWHRLRNARRRVLDILGR